MTRAQLDAWCEERDLRLTVMDGFDDCIVGIVERFNDTFVLYDRRKVVAKLMADGMDHEEAEEWYSFNQLGAWVGEHTPGFLLETEE
jgi:hypothetical protein